MERVRRILRQLFMCHRTAKTTEGAQLDNEEAGCSSIAHSATSSLVSPIPVSPRPEVTTMEKFEQQLRAGFQSALKHDSQTSLCDPIFRTQSAPPTFPDTKGLLLYPLQKVCAYAWCSQPRLYPRLYCKLHACHVIGCAGAIFIRPPSRVFRSTEATRAQYLYPDNIDDVYCFRHVCAAMSCRSRRQENGKHCITHTYSNALYNRSAGPYVV